MSRDRLTDLDAADVAFGHIARRFSCAQHIAIDKVHSVILLSLQRGVVLDPIYRRSTNPRQLSNLSGTMTFIKQLLDFIGLGHRSRLAAFVLACCLCLRDALTLPLKHNLPLESCD